MRCLHVMPENSTRVRYLDWALMWTHRFFDVQVQRTAGACVHTFPVSSEVIHCFAYPAITFCYCSHFKIASEKAKWRKVTYWVPCRASYVWIWHHVPISKYRCSVTRCEQHLRQALKPCFLVWLMEKPGIKTDLDESPVLKLLYESCSWKFHIGLGMGADETGSCMSLGGRYVWKTDSFVQESCTH